MYLMNAVLYADTYSPHGVLQAEIFIKPIYDYNHIHNPNGTMVPRVFYR